MDRNYIELIRSTIDCSHLANVIAKNANYNIHYDQAALPFIKDAQRKAQELGQVLCAILDRQQHAITQHQTR